MYSRNTCCTPAELNTENTAAASEAKGRRERRNVWIMLSSWPQTAFSSDSHHVPSWHMTQLSSSLCLWSPGCSQGQVQKCRAGILAAIPCHALDPLLYCFLMPASSSLRKLRWQWEHGLPRQLPLACCPRQELLGSHALDNLPPVWCCLIHAWPMASPVTWHH